MQVVDESLWQQQASELEADGEMGQQFRDFLTTWVEEAEANLETSSAAEALRGALVSVETRTGLRVSAHFMSQMLVVISTNWVHGEQMIKEMSPIERRIMEDALVLKITELSESAAADESE